MEELKRENRRRASTVIGVILCIVLIPVLIFNITIIIESYIHKDKIPGFLGYKPFIVLSGSMEPEFYAGDLVLVKETSAARLKTGDVIAFRKDNSVITHRIVSIGEQNDQMTFTTKGDNNNVIDGSLVSADKVEGKYIRKFAGLGQAAMFMQTPSGMILFIAAPLMLFFLFDFIRRRGLTRSEQAKAADLEEKLNRMKRQLEEAGVENRDDE